ncbi:MAG: glycosyltransferase family 4 protein [Patescibacteria group bacterium]
MKNNKVNGVAREGGLGQKILIATGIYPPDIGGPATILKALINSLENNGFDIKLITYSNVAKQEDDGDKIFRINRKKLFNQLSYFLKMYKLATWADLIYVTDTYSVGYFAYLIKKINSKKYVVRFVGDSAWETAVGNNWTTDYIVDFQNKKYSSKIERLKNRRKGILLGADRIIAVSNFIGSVAQQIGADKNKIKIIYNSIDFIDSHIDKQEVEKIRNKFGADAKIITTACRLTSWKGVDGIIKIMPQLKEKFGQVVLLVLGDGPELANLKNLAQELKVEDSVEFLGRVKHEKVANYFASSDLFILNTNYEAMSHTLLEVMRVKTPIIATTSGGNPEVIDDQKTGWLIPYNNLEELESAAVKILSDKNLADNLTAQATEKLKIFDWEKTISQTVNLLNEIYGR